MSGALGNSTGRPCELDDGTRTASWYAIELLGRTADSGGQLQHAASLDPLGDAARAWHDLRQMRRNGPYSESAREWARAWRVECPAVCAAVLGLDLVVPDPPQDHGTLTIRVAGFRPRFESLDQFHEREAEQVRKASAAHVAKVLAEARALGLEEVPRPRQLREQLAIFALVQFKSAEGVSAHDVRRLAACGLARDEGTVRHLVLQVRRRLGLDGVAAVDKAGTA